MSLQTPDTDLLYICDADFYMIVLITFLDEKDNTKLQINLSHNSCISLVNEISYKLQPTFNLHTTNTTDTTDLFR